LDRRVYEVLFSSRFADEAPDALEREEGVPVGRELMLRGAEERLAPIAMMALVFGTRRPPRARTSRSRRRRKRLWRPDYWITSGTSDATCMSISA
jgi:hypothetical protein